MTAEAKLKAMLNQMAADLKHVTPKPGAGLYQLHINAAGDASWSAAPGYEFIFPLGGQFLADPNEVNGIGNIGPYDNTNTQDLGNVGAANLSWLAGGLSFPWPVKLKRFWTVHRINNSAVEPWGWVIFRQTKTNASATVSTTYILDEVADNAGVGPRDYGNTIIRISDETLDETIPAGEVLGWGIAAPTAITTNRYVQILSGYFLFEKVIT